jgi:hypothetical protein
MKREVIRVEPLSTYLVACRGEFFSTAKPRRPRKTMAGATMVHNFSLRQATREPMPPYMAVRKVAKESLCFP